MPYIKFQGHRSTGSREEDFKGFYYLLAWPPCWSYDLDHFNNFCSLCLEYSTLNFGNNWPMLTDNTRKYLLEFKGYMTKNNTCLFATVLCLILENVYGRPSKKINKNKNREMDWQLVASYFTVKSTDIFCSASRQSVAKHITYVSQVECG